MTTPIDTEGGSAMSDRWYQQQAKSIHGRDGAIEFDDVPLVSAGGDRGAYVQAWVWVDDPDPDDVGPIFILGEEPTTCPQCGSRTDFDENDDDTQSHRCLNRDCGFDFLGVFDDDDDAEPVAT